MNVKKLFATLVVSQLFFGINLAYGWTIKMDFNDGPLGGSTDAPNGGKYQRFSDAAGKTVYADCLGHVLDGQCAKLQIDKGHDGFGVWGGRIQFSERGVSNLVKGSEVWISVKVFMPLTFDYSAMPHLKFLRLHTKSPAKSNEGYHDWYITPDGPNHWDGTKNSDKPYWYVFEGQPSSARLLGEFTKNKPKLGSWENYEFYIKFDTLSVNAGGTGRVRMWKNGELLADYKHINTLVTDASYVDNFFLFGYWNGGNPTKTGSYPTQSQFMFVDDLTLTTDKPLQADSNGNPYIGDLVKLPSPPTNLIAVK